MNRAFPWCLALSLLVAAPVRGAGLAELDAAAKEAYLLDLRAANQSFDAGRFDEALGRYDALVPRAEVAEVHFRRAACLERLGRPADAAAAYRRYLGLAPEARDAGRVQADIARLEQAAAQAARIVVTVTSRPSGADVRRDGPAGALLGRTPLDVEVPEGEVRLHVGAAGHTAELRPLVLRAGERRQVEVVLAPLPSPPPGPAGDAKGEPDADLRPWAWGCAGLGAALGATAGLLGWLTLSTIDEANDYPRRKPGNSRSDLDSIQERGRAYETGFWITGGAALAAGLGAGALFLLD